MRDNMADKQKILIVDDDNNIAELVSLYLIKECFDTQIANDGEEALAAIQNYQPDLVVLDIMLPGMSGYDVLRELRKTSNLPVIMLSAKGETFDKVLGLELGADDYVMKPFDTKELVARIKAVLQSLCTRKLCLGNRSDSEGVRHLSKSYHQSHRLLGVLF